MARRRLARIREEKVTTRHTRMPTFVSGVRVSDVLVEPAIEVDGPHTTNPPVPLRIRACPGSAGLEAIELANENRNRLGILLADLGSWRIDEQQTAAKHLSPLQFGQNLRRRLKSCWLKGIERTAF